jgi:para-aminobenzoate synthetase/4-amino-4-deoxychorismate lyase
VAIEVDNVLYTPPVQCCLLPEIKHIRLLEQSKSWQKKIIVDEILASSKVFLLNSMRGMYEVNVAVLPA